MDLLLDFSHAEGDFDWALAFHPYPQNLFEPRVWEDNQVKFSFDTPKITFKNLEVLDAWMKQPRAAFNGRPRAVHLSEQGLNSRDYSEKSLLDQAAGMTYAWNKYKNLSSIEVFHYHNWVDNRGEGGLRIGLSPLPRRQRRAARQKTDLVRLSGDRHRQRRSRDRLRQTNYRHQRLERSVVSRRD